MFIIVNIRYFSIFQIAFEEKRFYNIVQNYVILRVYDHMKKLVPLITIGGF